MTHKKIKNIIFDLGGVIVDLDTSKTIAAFARLSGKREKEIIDIAENPLFKLYEKGEIDSNKFRTGLKSLMSIDCNDQLIDAAWNAMIGDTPLHRMKWLSVLNDKYRIFILSNTNQIHIAYVHNYLYNGYRIHDFTNHVEKVYYSQIIGMRKPDKEIFEFVVNENNLTPDNTLFLDDNVENVKGANDIGIQTIHVKHPEDTPQLLTNAGIEI